MNLTRCFSNMYCHYGDKPLSIGRVQTPTLKMIVDREKEIISHVKKYSYRPEIKYSNITAEYIEKFENKEDAELIARRADDQDFIVSKVKIETKRKKHHCFLI
ncbi:DNA topoisomerase [Coprobacillaceae bacterium CR2/5/TPMF4]|nr:DNA topoisomerase [Coprobacillaceae bacterium CR2/5/TPMF4]